ncbi:MAG: cobalamin-dependent protein, partial [Aquihabitans sp.]
SGYGPMALLACLPGDQHDLGLICFGLALRTNGWRITFLGPDTPLATVAETAILLRPAIVVLSATIPPDQAVIGEELKAITAVAPLALAGAGATENAAVAVGARLLPENPFVAAQAIAAATPPA